MGGGTVLFNPIGHNIPTLPSSCTKELTTPGFAHARFVSAPPATPERVRVCESFRQIGLGGLYRMDQGFSIAMHSQTHTERLGQLWVARQLEGQNSTARQTEDRGVVDPMV